MGIHLIALALFATTMASVTCPVAVHLNGLPHPLSPGLDLDGIRVTQIEAVDPAAPRTPGFPAAMHRGRTRTSYRGDD